MAKENTQVDVSYVLFLFHDSNYRTLKEYFIYTGSGFSNKKNTEIMLF